MSSVTEERRKDEGVTRNVGSQDERFDAAQSGAAADDDQTPPKEMDPQAVSPRQRLALEAFCKGGTIGDAAKAADVSRQTLHRWRAKYPHFALAMSSWSSACVAIAESQLEELASRAVCALAIAIDKGDARSAMAVLRSLGILRTYQPSKAPPAGAEKPLALPGMDFLAQALAGAPQEELNPGAPGSSEQEKEAVANCMRKLLVANRSEIAIRVFRAPPNWAGHRRGLHLRRPLRAAPLQGR
jgi:transposase-like protein